MAQLSIANTASSNQKCKYYPQNNLNAKNSGRIKIENEDFLMYDVPGDGQCFFHALSLAIIGNLSQSLVYRSLICSEIYNNFDFY
jgi:hypothetical protein